MATITANPQYYGVVLKSGSRGPDVALVQTWRNGVRSRWPQLVSLTVDGRYGDGVTRTVMQFQTLTGLKADGKVGANTWNQLYTSYAEIHGEGEIYPGYVVVPGARGAVVKSMQQKLARLSRTYTGIQSIQADGIFGASTSSALRRFQPQFGLTGDGLMGLKSFTAMGEADAALQAGSPMQVVTRYVGYILQRGSSGDWVRFLQSYLNQAGGMVPTQTVDGKFGSKTDTAVRAFQAQNQLKVDGKVGRVTWQAVRAAFNASL